MISNLFNGILSALFHVVSNDVSCKQNELRTQNLYLLSNLIITDSYQRWWADAVRECNPWKEPCYHFIFRELNWLKTLDLIQITMPSGYGKGFRMEIPWITDSMHTSGSHNSVVFVVGMDALLCYALLWPSLWLCWFMVGLPSHQQIINCVEQTVMVSIIIITKTHNNNSNKRFIQMINTIYRTGNNMFRINHGLVGIVLAREGRINSTRLERITRQKCYFPSDKLKDRII